MTDHAGYLGIPAASDAGRVVRALQQAGRLPVSRLAQAIRTQHSDAMAALKQLTERGVVQIRHPNGEPVAVLTSQPEAPDDPPEATPVEEKKKPTPPAEKPKKARAAAATQPKPPEAPLRVIRNADVFAVIPTSASDAMTCSEIAEAMKLRPSERKKFYCAIERLRKLDVLKGIRITRGHFRYYRGRATLKDDSIPEHWEKILDVLPIAAKDGITLGDVIERAGLKSSESFSYRDAKTDLEKMMKHGLIGPLKSDGPGCPRKYYRIVEGEQEMTAPIIDTTIATLSHDAEIGQPHGKLPNGSGVAALGDDLIAGRSLPVGEGYTNRQELKPLPVVASELPDDSDIADAVAALTADTQARDLRDESIDDEAPIAASLKTEWANVSLHELIAEMRERKAQLERDMKAIGGIADATLGMTVMEAVDLMEWLSKRLIESHEQKHAGGERA